jgi:hypothetical protein
MVEAGSLRMARNFILEQGGRVAPLSISEEELNPGAQDDLSLQAYALESTARTYPVPYHFPEDSGTSEFSFFEDGRQRTTQIGYLRPEVGATQILVPVHYVAVGAAILRREDGVLRPWRAARLREGILVERSLVPRQGLLEEYERQGMQVFASGATGADYYELRRAALRKAKGMRLQAENELIAEWRMSEEAGDNFLVVDGTLMNFRNEDNVERCVGVSKSFGSRYFDIGEHNRMMQMPQFERSWLFRFHSPEDEDDSTRMGARERISWYLRLRARASMDPEFGLVRVEISIRHEDWAASLAERISRALISERLPTSYPYPRWDKHLFPIRQCEQYLNSLMRSVATVNASMGGG